jgi:hypothetical protein
MTAVEALSPDGVEAERAALAGLLHACVHEGASIGFVLPFPRAEAEAFWRDAVLPAARAGHRRVLVARIGGRIAGSVQLATDTPPNGRHRAEIVKLMVHPELRRRGIARALVSEAEALARALGRSLLTLDTRTGDSGEPLYRALGYATAGMIPGYCRDPARDTLDATTVMYKAL